MSLRSGLGLPLHVHSLSGKVVIYGKVKFIHEVVVSQQQYLVYIMECLEIDMMKFNLACEQLLENPWLPVQYFIDGFNEHVKPGTYRLIDEITSPWLGLDADYAMNGVPHRTA